MLKKNYFPHIDGLRGIAVLLVLLFHIDVSFFKGGYIGVYVFFVISGYLISTILINKIDANTFSFKDFYTRRINRLMPSLLFVVIVSMFLSYFIFPLHIFEKSLKSSTASILSYSHIFFFKESGYFDSGAYLKPLLHSWSLSVEEQFYLIWPLLLFFTLKIKKNKFRILTLIAIGVLSLIACEYYLTINSSAAFFLTPFRVFEFIIGTLIFWANRFELKPYLKELLALIAIGGLVILGCLYDDKTVFPGINALLPCVFSALLIHNTGQAKYVGFIYNNYIIRWFGKISYSLYLIHWPFIVFYKFLYNKELGLKDQIILFTVSTFAGFFIYKFIETPFREKKSKTKPSKTIIYVLSTLALIVSFNVIALKYDTLVFNTKNSRKYTLKQIEDGKGLRFKFCGEPFLNDIKLENTAHKQQVLILGDSHAPDALNFLKLAYPDYDYRMLTEGGCPPMTKFDMKLIDGHPPEMKNNCYTMMDTIINMDLKGYEFIVINIMFEWYKPDNLINYIDELKKKTDAKIIVFGNYVVLNSDLVDLSASGKIITNNDVKSIALYEEELEIKSKGLYRYISKKKLLCKANSNDIKDCVLFTKQNAPMTYDSNHLSFELAKTISDSLISKKIKVFN
jgi:peptidoglycan/LPS O-acetylase OafA/YrhL